MRTTILVALVALGLGLFIAQQHNALSDVRGAPRAQNGSGVLYTSNSSAPIGEISVNYFVRPHSGRSDLCILQAQFENRSNAAIRLGPLHLSIRDDAGIQNMITESVPNLAPGESIPNVSREVYCTSFAGGVHLNKGGMTEWPNACIINDKPQTECPINVRVIGHGVAISP